MKTDASNIADAIKTLLADGKIRRELGSFGRQAVVRHFSIETMTDEVLKVYHQVIEEVNDEPNR